MSELQRVAIGLVAAGLVGAAWMAVYLVACAWADWELIPVWRHARLHGWQRRGPRVLAVSATVLAVGLVLGGIALLGPEAA
jgi:hypothetical protein